MARTQINASLVAALNQTAIGLGRNRIINGAMEIDQQNGGAAQTANNATLAYTPDMYLGLSNFGGSLEGVISFQRVSATPPTGFTHYMRASVTTADASIAAGNAYEFLTSIEGNNVIDFSFGTASAKTITVSFWVRSSVTGTYGLGVLNNDSSRSYVGQYTVNAANTWEQKAITLAGDTTGTWLTNTGRGLQVYFDLGSGSTFQGTANAWNAGSFWRASGNVQWITNAAATWDLTGLQVEIGSNATPFEHRLFPLEIMLCQRYYEKSYAFDTAIGTATTTDESYTAAVQSIGTNYNGPLFFKVPKRVTPTITYYNSSTGSSGSWRAYSTAGTDANITPSASATATHSFLTQNGTNSSPLLHGHWVAAARLQ